MPKICTPVAESRWSRSADQTFAIDDRCVGDGLSVAPAASSPTVAMW